MAVHRGLTAGLVCGAGHSGSTLLGMLLGSHPSVFFMGEGSKVRYLGDLRRPVHKRACKMCGDDCVVWSGFRWDRSQPLYAQLARHVGRDVIIDSTKNADWIIERAAETQAAGGRACLIFLRRDGRAVINSRLRKYPDIPAEDQIRHWMNQIERAEQLFANFQGPKLRLDYERLATTPEASLRAVCDLFAIDFTPSMMQFHRADHHPLGGNNGPQFLAAREKQAQGQKAVVKLRSSVRSYYENHENTIRLDLRWKQELSAEHLALFETLAGHLNVTPSLEG